MSSFKGTFVARIEDGRQTPLQVKIPQVFQGTNVPLDKWVGPRPTSGEEGYVIFINADPTWPVWLGSQLGTTITESDLTAIATPEPVNELYWIGPEAPTDDSYTLWYDTDASPAVVGTVHMGFTKTTDGTGQISVSAAELGLSVINGVTGNLMFSVAAGAPFRIAVRLFTTVAVPTGGTSVQGIVYNSAGATVNSTSVTFWIVAWGVPA
jgi:hypothetical protein